MGENPTDCAKCQTPDDAYIWVNENWRVRSMDRPSGLPMVLILESRSHLDLGDLPNMLAAELGVMTVRLERAVRSLDGVARVHVNRWGDGAAHLHLWFMARPYGRLQLRGTFLTLWDEILPSIPEQQWRENLALIAAWLAEFGGEPLAKPPRIDWQAPSSFAQLIPTSEPPAPPVPDHEPTPEVDPESAAEAMPDAAPEAAETAAATAAETAAATGAANAPGGLGTGDGPDFAATRRGAAPAEQS